MIVNGAAAQMKGMRSAFYNTNTTVRSSERDNGRVTNGGSAARINSASSPPISPAHIAYKKVNEQNLCQVPSNLQHASPRQQQVVVDVIGSPSRSRTSAYCGPSSSHSPSISSNSSSGTTTNSPQIDGSSSRSLRWNSIRGKQRSVWPDKPSGDKTPEKRRESFVAMSTRKLSLFNRWKNQTLIDSCALEGISEEEMVEYKEAFRLFDKVRNTKNFVKCIIYFFRTETVQYHRRN